MSKEYTSLSMKSEDVYKLSYEERLNRLSNLIEEAKDIYQNSLDIYIAGEKKNLTSTCVLFSGGNDSIIVLHLFKDIADYVIHINTGIGIEKTRDFVRQTCKDMNLELKEYKASGENSYESLVLKYGFPGPAQHFLMYQRLKERQLRVARNELNRKRSYKNRIIFITGKRRDESSRRVNAPDNGRDGNVIWVAPMVNWTKSDIELYRKLNPEIPRNEVSDLIHMSGECLCGAFAHPNEREEIKMFFPEMIEEIEELEKKVEELNIHPNERRKWGWGAEKKYMKKNKKVGSLCSSCESSQFETENSSHKGGNHV
jgi:3'-phosphoadenosine 5'-phosphosulfate sulfotransferase (PAPS reductase)/FAD synthetase